MNHTVKWHKAKGPAFNPGEVWVGSGGLRVEVVEVRKYPGATSDHMSDYGVTYTWQEHGNPVQHEKDCWNFQVRYKHQADSVV